MRLDSDRPSTISSPRRASEYYIWDMTPLSVLLRIRTLIVTWAELHCIFTCSQLSGRIADLLIAFIIIVSMMFLGIYLLSIASITAADLLILSNKFYSNAWLGVTHHLTCTPNNALYLRETFESWHLIFIFTEIHYKQLIVLGVQSICLV